MKAFLLILVPLAGAAAAAAWPNERTRPWFLPATGGLHAALTLWFLIDPPAVAPGAWIGFDPLAMNVAESDAYFKKDIADWAVKVKAVGFSN